MERTKYDKEVKMSFVLKWTKCEHCGNEFKFERMYQFKTLSFWKAYTYSYGCTKCFNDKEDFYNYMIEKDEETCGIHSNGIAQLRPVEMGKDAKTVEPINTGLTDSAEAMSDIFGRKLDDNNCTADEFATYRTNTGYDVRYQ